MPEFHTLQHKFIQIWPHLDERSRRLIAATEAQQIGYGGISLVSRACGLSRVTITKGLQELHGNPLPPGRLRRPGAGRHKIVVSDPELPNILEYLVEPLTRGDPESPLRWTCKSTRSLASEMTGIDHPYEGLPTPSSDGLQSAEQSKN
jgi:hypothetical protein